jgi:6-phosphofructo-2-kinase
VLERNFRLKLSGPDYKEKDHATALSDFRHRVQNYEKAYEPVGDWEEEHDIQYCKLVNVGKKVIAHNISGYLSGQCIFYLMNFNLQGKLISLKKKKPPTNVQQNVKYLSHDMVKVRII